MSSSSSIGASCIVGDQLCPAHVAGGFLKGFLTYIQRPALSSLAADGAQQQHQQQQQHQRPMITAAGCGAVERTENVVSVRGLFPRYNGEVGDVVVARVVDVAGTRWICDVGAPQHAILPLSHVTEPGGMLRRRGRDDETSMRALFREGDLVVAEVQRVSGEGTVLLHTRSASKYGRCLGDGIAVVVRPHLVRREGKQFCAFPCGVSAVIGVNGNVWVFITTEATLAAMKESWGTTAAGLSHASTKQTNADDAAVAGAAGGVDDAKNGSGAIDGERRIHTDIKEARTDVARMRCCLLLMSRLGCRIDAACMLAAFRATRRQLLPVPSMLDHGSPAGLVVQLAVADARRAAQPGVDGDATD